MVFQVLFSQGPEKGRRVNLSATETLTIGEGPSATELEIQLAPHLLSPADAALWMALSDLITTTPEAQRLLEQSLDRLFAHFQTRQLLWLTQRDNEWVISAQRLSDAQSPPQIARDLAQRTLESWNVQVAHPLGEPADRYQLVSVGISGFRKFFGVLQLDGGEVGFTSPQVRMLSALGRQVGLALENAQLYPETAQLERLAATGQTVASLSHSIKNILQGLRFGADIVEYGLKKNGIEEIRQGWHLLQRNLDKVYTLTMNMLAFSKDRRPEYELILLPDLINECLELFRPMVEDRQVQLKVYIEENQPPIPLDPDGLHQAILNLLGNALDAVEPGKGRIELQSFFDTATQEAHLVVLDNGTGIDAADLEKIFTAFFSTKGQRGTGLGLAVTRKIIDEHQGHIHVQSTLGVGTRFEISLPIQRQTARSGPPRLGH